MSTYDHKPCENKRRRRERLRDNAIFNDVLIWVGAMGAVVLIILFVVASYYLDGS
jgi:hypothetical protein